MRIKNRGNRFELIVEDEGGGRMKCVWFHGARWMSKLFKNGDRVAFHGKPQQFGRQFSFTHPDFDKLDEEGPALATGRIIALYPGGAALDKVGLNSRTFRHIVYNLITEHGLKLQELFPEWLVRQYDLLDGRVARVIMEMAKEEGRRLKDGRIAFRTTPGSKLGAAATGSTCSDSRRCA